MIFLAQDTELNIKTGLSLLYFYSSWLLFHRTVLAEIEKSSKAYRDINIYGIDTEQFPGFITRFNISSLPTILIFKDEGKIVQSIIGIQAISSLKERLHDIYMAYTKGEYHGKAAEDRDGKKYHQESTGDGATPLSREDTSREDMG